ncbi:MAG: IS1/IS1595 family N-terminal zinc-binding domain-containing protein [Methylovulum sp.]
MTCTCCGSNKLTRNGKTRQGKQKFRCLPAVVTAR